MTQIKKITDANGVKIFPQTHTNAVVDNNGYTAESRLQAMQDEINAAQLEVGAVGSDLAPTENSTNYVTSGGLYNALNYGDPNIEIDLTQYDAVRAFPNPTIWLVTNDNYPFYGKFIPITAGKKYTIVANAENTSYYAFLTTNSYAQNDTVSYATGCSRVVLDANESVTDEAPLNAAYLYITTMTSASCEPQEIIMVNKKSVFDALDEIDDKADISYVDETKSELEDEIELSKYSFSELTDNWATNDSSAISWSREGENIIITNTTSTAKKRCGLDISEINVGDMIYLNFTSSVGVVFGVGETLASSFVNVGTYTSSFFFTKTSATQKYLYIPSNSYSSGTILTLVGFKVYNAVSISQVSQKIDAIEGYAFQPSSYIPIKESYERYMTISATSGQGSTIYGDYFVNGFTYAKTYIQIYNLTSKELVQQVDLPTFANPRYHANTISFSGTKYNADDDFPLLYICSGYTDSSSVTTSEVYVVRIVGTSGSYTTELIQTIYLDFGTWTEWVCDPVRNVAWINGSGIAKYICVSIPDTTDAEVTIDSTSTIIDSFNTKTFTLGTTTKSSGQGRFFYHNRVYWVSGVPSYAGEGIDALYVCVDNTLTHSTEAVVPLRNFGLTGEPEGCFIWNDDFYVAYRGSIMKLIQN